MEIIPAGGEGKEDFWLSKSSAESWWHVGDMCDWQGLLLKFGGIIWILFDKFKAKKKI